MRKNSARSFPKAAEIGKRAVSGDSGRFPVAESLGKVPGAGVVVNLAKLRSSLSGRWREDTLKYLRHTAKKGLGNQRRQALAEYESCIRIENGTYSKHFTETNPRLYIDTDGEIYTVDGNRKGQYLEGITPSQVPAAVEYDDSDEQNRREQAFLDDEADWERTCKEETAKAEALKGGGASDSEGT